MGTRPRPPLPSARDMLLMLTGANCGCGLSSPGHGFKFGPLIGKLLCELSQGEKPSHDLSPFRIARFRQKSAL